MSLTLQGESQYTSLDSPAHKEVPLPLCCLEDLRLMITERAWFLHWWLLHKWVILSYKHIILSSNSIYSTVPPRHHQDRQISWHKNWHSSPEEQWEAPEQDACREWRCNCITGFRRTTFDPTIRRGLLEEGHIWAETWKVKRNQPGKIWGENSSTLNSLYPQLYSALTSIKTQNKDDRDAESYLILGRNNHY